jgi:hypothetical protein
MFLRVTNRHKDGKDHRYYSVVENRRVRGGKHVQRIGARIANRMKVETVQDKGVWLVREAPSAYSSFSAS